MPVLTVQDLRKSFGKNEVVKGVSFQVNEGATFGFLGKNGAGKSTTINILTGVMYATSGSFTMLGKPHTQLDEIKREIGVMPDAANFYTDMTALAHLRFFAQIKGIKSNTEQLRKLLNEVGLTDHEGKKVAKFSFGMKKKLGIAQALVGSPKLIFLDEPTSGVDAESILNIHEIILRLRKKGITVLMTSHNMSEVEKLCTDIAIMQQGVIAASGTLSELQAEYESSVNVILEVPAFPVELLGILKFDLGETCIQVSYHEGLLDCEMTDKSQIPDIHYWLADRRIDTYQVRLKQATLEEIFISI
ncbi:ABC transporter ATP-binding protein [Paenibacillus sp. N1-5-1-14]|uniref:ABC transporter ATP-binding protein n=1 Tax=Paenibacillus radicibacter TaxID=2972488 RepID=UPI002159A249|nr:ABC transporter ATP-binding protein [Paenibacillus radicibacter]MCR8645250.1 ABC transporter ATP-binding protein [Paenibacillus radicibacter]